MLFRSVCVDLKYLKTTDRRRCVALSAVDAGTGFHAASLLKTRRTDHVARKFFMTWVSHYGVPEKIICDQGGEFMGVFIDMCENLGIDTKVTGAHAGWQNGVIERHGAILEQLWNAILQEHSEAQGGSTRWLELALASAIQAKHSTLQRYGYTPEQAVFGRALRWPSVLTDGEDHPIAALDADPESEYTQAVQMRNTARLALISRDATDKIKRAILRKTRPERPERMLLGMRVYFWSPHPLKGRNRNDPHRWRGPATVVAPDGDSRYFLSWRGKLLLTSRDQLRLATAEEAAAADIIAEDAIITGENVHEEQDKRAVDLTDHQPVEDPNPRQEITRALAKNRKVTIKEPLKVPIRPNFLRAQRKALADARRMLGLAVPGRKPRNPPQAVEQRIEPQEQQGAIEPPQVEEDKSMEAQAPESEPQIGRAHV